MAWRKINKNTWQIDSRGVGEIVAKYNVYANELTVRTNELNADHAFFNNAALLMFPKDNLKTASTLKIVPFGDWKIATGLPKVEGQANTFRAENFDILYDSPFEVGISKKSRSPCRTNRTALSSKAAAITTYNKIAQDTAKIVEAGVQNFRRTAL